MLIHFFIRSSEKVGGFPSMLQKVGGVETPQTPPSSATYEIARKETQSKDKMIKEAINALK